MSNKPINLDGVRIDTFMKTLQAMAAGDDEAILPISNNEDSLDAIAYAVNVIKGELTLSKQHEQRANKAKDDFLAYLSHELRTPLSIILGYATLLKDPKVNVENKKDSLDRILNSCNYLLKLTDDILDISRIEIGTIKLDIRKIKLINLISDNISSLQPRAEAKGLKLQLINEISPATLVNTDPTKLSQIIINLVSNALKFTSNGGVQVKVWQHEDHSTSLYYIDISDTGIGIEPTFLKKMFQPFSQEKRTPYHQEGSGLGLALSKKLAQAIGGELNLIKSEVNAGSTFRISLISSELDEIVDLSDDSDKSALQIKGEYRFLIAEDNPDLRRLCCIYIKRLAPQSTIVEVESGEEAVSKALKEKFDMILMDVQMPGLDGNEAVKILRAKKYKGPVICISALAMPQQQKELSEAGFNEIIIKPIKFNELFKKIEGLLKK